MLVPRDYVPSPESTHDLYQLDVGGFSGPLDLLLMLIRRHQINIFDIPISFICDRYVACLHDMHDLNIDVAAEFMLMSAELMYIKSKLLLPKPAADNQEEEVDPRAALVARLLEYQIYQRATASMEHMLWLGRDNFARRKTVLPDTPSQQLPLQHASIFALVQAFHALLKKQTPEVRHQVIVESMSVRARMQSIVPCLVGVDAVQFVVLLKDNNDRFNIVLTFLAVLELARIQLIQVYQSEHVALYVQPKFALLDEALALIYTVQEPFEDRV